MSQQKVNIFNITHLGSPHLRVNEQRGEQKNFEQKEKKIEIVECYDVPINNQWEQL